MNINNQLIDYLDSIASKSDLHYLKMAAIVIKNRKPVYGLFGYNYHITPGRSKYSIHAEEDLLIRAAKMGYKMQGATVVIYRSNYHGLAISKPCKQCEHKLRKAGVRNVIYFQDGWLKERYT